MWLSLIRVYTVCLSVLIFRRHYCIVKPHCLTFRRITVNFLSFRTDRSGQTVQTQIRLLLFAIPSASFGLMVEPHSSDFRVITTNLLGVRIFRKFTVQRIVRCPNFFLIFVVNNKKKKIIEMRCAINKKFLFCFQSSDSRRTRTGFNSFAEAGPR